MIFFSTNGLCSRGSLFKIKKKRAGYNNIKKQQNILCLLLRNIVIN